ncbi:MAG: hypothetical protein MJ238_07065, partial [Bacilli bacterium]|nr:hypothetical protein [Bacilli bacterium]
MKKKKSLLILASMMLVGTVSCGKTDTPVDSSSVEPSTSNNEPTSSSESPSISGSSSEKKDEVITGVEIAGPSSILKGRTAMLVADVLGSDDDSVTWSS